jgi:hypothetical protein
MRYITIITISWDPIVFLKHYNVTITIQHMDLDDHNPWSPWEKLSEVTRIRAWTRFPTPTTVVPELGSE